MDENPDFAKIIKNSVSPLEANKRTYEWVMSWLADGHAEAVDYLHYKRQGVDPYSILSWREIGAIRIIDYINNAGRVFENLVKEIRQSVSDPIRVIWMGYHNGKRRRETRLYPT
ncbi:MAG: hypothetical protein R2744_11215 [Bacteroidales bacterium]